MRKKHIFLWPTRRRSRSLRLALLAAHLVHTKALKDTGKKSRRIGPHITGFCFENLELCKQRSEDSSQGWTNGLDPLHTLLTITSLQPGLFSLLILPATPGFLCKHLGWLALLRLLSRRIRTGRNKPRDTKRPAAEPTGSIQIGGWGPWCLKAVQKSQPKCTSTSDTYNSLDGKTSAI